jgi:hypothetical protein
VRPDEDPEPAVERFRRRIARPLITDLEIHWGGLEVTELLPSRLPDLFDHPPLVVLGRYRKGGTAEVIVHGRSGARLRDTKVTVTLPDREERHAALSSVWARKKIEGLDRLRVSSDADGTLAEQITSLGREHRLLTAFTSFVAVDQTVPDGKGPPELTVFEPHEAVGIDDLLEDRFRSRRLTRTQTIRDPMWTDPKLEAHLAVVLPQVLGAPPPDIKDRSEPPTPLDAEVISQVVKRAHPEFQACFEKDLTKSQPESIGRLTFALDVARGGQVRRVTLRAEPRILLSLKFRSCLERVAFRLTFPRAAERRTAEFALEFPLTDR